MPKQKRKKKYRYYTTVLGQFGEYDVHFTSKKEQQKYRKALEKQSPYFTHVKSGKVK